MSVSFMQPIVRVAGLLPPTFFNCSFRFFHCCYPPVSDHLKHCLFSVFTYLLDLTWWWWQGSGGEEGWGEELL